jgi:hypothetical protein
MKVSLTCHWRNVRLLEAIFVNKILMTADTGDGFGNNGTGGARVALDTEGLVLGDDNTYWISDEYGSSPQITICTRLLTSVHRPLHLPIQ